MPRFAGLAGIVVEFIIPIGTGLLLALWPSDLAPPWKDELNPITGAPYRSPEEYDEVRRMSPVAVTKAIPHRRRQQPQDAPRPMAEPTRRYANQTCENEVLDAFGLKIHEICDSGWSCSDEAERDFIGRQDPKGKRPTRKQLPGLREQGKGFTVEELLRRKLIGEECLRLRKLRQKECFGDAPEPGHDKQNDDVKKGVEDCNTRPPSSRAM